MLQHRLIPALLTTGFLFSGALLAALGPARQPALAAALPDEVGLSLFFQNGQMPPLTLVGNPRRYLQEVDIVATTPTTATDQGLAALIQSSDLAGLDWTGIHLVEEDWRPDTDGTRILQRLYCGARWMNLPSRLPVAPLDGAGQPIGETLVAQAGRDDRWDPGDDGFVRRFVVRQIVRHCANINDLTGANSFTVQGLVQFRDALHADRRA